MYKQGDILLVPIPFSDLESEKKRPVIVISNIKYNLKTKDIVVAAITSNIKQKDYSILLNNSDMIEGTLKVDKIYTISKDIIIKKFGRVSNKKISEVTKMINLLISDEDYFSFTILKEEIDSYSL